MVSINLLALTSTFALAVRAQACTLPPLDLPTKTTFRLPDPFTLYDGQRVTTLAEWGCKQLEIRELFQRKQLGMIPGKPSSVQGSASENGDTITVNVRDGDKSISFAASIRYPSSATSPVPAIIALGGSNIPISNDIALITFNNEDIAAGSSVEDRGRGKFYELYGFDHPAGALSAWAWGVSRLIDALESTPSIQSRIDLKKLGVTGCWRNGIGAFIAGAFESRIALTIPQESGGGGSACWRLSEGLHNSGPFSPTASQVDNSGAWFSPNFKQYVGRVNDLPFDHHFLAALVAPRGLLVIEHSSIDWLVPESTYGCMTAGRKVYKALGMESSMGFSQIGAHAHCQFPESQRSDLEAFILKFLHGDSAADTNIFKSDRSINFFVEWEWIKWSVPSLKN
ncbi:hypothetical protein FA15DRAFT_592221 [Coprinopsis marcescibilis]|uniref:(4-O-methyl)-D-glucuronate--lignin esterase n=1 Tax=Coprinopsis marcescibilis TaxID=230819 RepID=A0A5C3KWF9_COPMA|nr:hypothetical protein FA15DRAFT_592221 [Coprinopsis marcescibilis]